MFTLHLLSDRSEKPANATEFLNDVYKTATQAKKSLAGADLYGRSNRYIKKKVAGRCQLYASTTGRSMVEMLGVLAIIGVLSVGAIAGYSKAMMKYKLNRQSEQLTQVLNAVTRLAGSFNNLTEHTDMLPYLIKMGEIPQEMIKGDSSKIFDVFNNDYRAFVQPKSMSGDDDTMKGIVSLFIQIPISTKSSDSLLICQNIYNNIKENSADIYYVYSSTGYGTDHARTGTFLGDNYCYPGGDCLKDITISKLTEECSRHFGNGDSESIVVLWKM